MPLNRGGSAYASGYKSLSTNEAMKSAESLLEQKTITEIKEIEAKTRADIESKKKQLRQLVGSSYRELIASADTIVQMAEVCRNVVSNIATIQDSFSGLVQDIAAAKGNKFQKAESLRHEELYAVGSRVKYLVDTPEMIWGCLDSCDFLEGAHRFLRASEVHRLLVSGASKQVMHQFPLLRHQWPLVQKFRQSIRERAQHSLRSEATLGSERTADALAAVAFLSELDSSQSLELYLDCRRMWIVNQLKSAMAEGGAGVVDAVAQVMCNIAAVVQDTVAQAGDLFLVPYMETGVPLLVAKAADDGMSSSELLFGALPHKAEDQPLSEVDAWELCIRTIRQRLSPMSQSDVASACSNWIGSIAKNHGDDILRLLSSCRSAADLAAVEQRVRSSLSKWRKAQPEGDKVVRMALPFGSQPSLASQHSDGSAPGPSASRVDTWQDVCDWVLQRRCTLWNEVFDAAYLDCAKGHICRWFDEIANGLEGPLEECLKSIANSDAALVGAYRPKTWPDTAATVASRQLPLNGHPTSTALSPRKAPPVGWRVRLDEIVVSFDDQLHHLLSGVLQVVEDVAEGIEDGDSVSGGHRRRSSSGSRRMSSSRAMTLEPFVQDKCCHLANLIADRMNARLIDIPAPAPGPAGAPAVEAALCIARVCSAIATGSVYLRVILGPPEDWRDSKSLSLSTSVSAGGLGRRNSSSGNVFKVRSQHSRLGGLQQRLKHVAMLGYLTWAQWAAAGLAEGLIAGMQAHAMLSLNTVLRSWEETVVKQEGDSELEGPVEMRFSLPAAASAWVVSFLMATCSEVQRAGGHAIDSSVLSMMEGEVAEAALNALNTALLPDSQLSARLSEKGVLQILFDLRLMRDVLCGGKKYVMPQPTNQANGGSHTDEQISPRANSGTAWNKQGWQDLELALAERLDPIDWATYEPFLWTNESRYYQRCSVLFGSLMQSNRLHSASALKMTVSSDTNLLSIAPPCARFSYLPISMPSLGATSPHLAPANAHVALHLDMTGDYSFANIGGERLASEAVGSSAESATATAFEALQSRFSSQRFGALGSLLGDKAAEVTAMAQQSLGEMALPGGFTTGSGFFSTLGKTFRSS